VQVARSTRYTK